MENFDLRKYLAEGKLLKEENIERGVDEGFQGDEPIGDGLSGFRGFDNKNEGFDLVNTLIERLQKLNHESDRAGDIDEAYHLLYDGISDIVTDLKGITTTNK